MGLASRFVRVQTFRALRHRNFRLLWLGQTGHSASLWMDQVARAVLILDLTGSALMLSLVIATRLVPILLFGLIAGAIADRADRKKVLLATQLTTFSTHVFLGVAVVTGFVDVWMVFATALVAGTAMAFNQPVRQSLIPMTVPREDLMNAVALNSTALSFMRIGGGSLAGVLLIPFNAGGVYLVNAGIYVLVTLMTVMLQLPAGPVRGKERTGLFADLKEGFVYVGQNRDLAVVVSLAVILFVFGFPYQQVFTPLLAKETLDLGDSGVGFLAGATGVGAFIGSLVVASLGSIRRPGLQLLFNLIVLGAVLVFISLQATVIGTALLIAVAGSMTVTYMAFTNGILLANAAPEMHGRVMSLLSLDRGLIPLGAILAGLLASGLGVRPGLFVMGMLVLSLAIVTLLFFGRRLASITSDERPPEGEARVVEAHTPADPRRAAAGMRHGGR
ncbi:MAG: MFS transporter [Dehalococcoidia bacterium]